MIFHGLVTVRRIMANPGRLFREYLGGMRSSYYKPIAFFILNTAVYILIRALVDYDPLEGRFENMENGDAPDSVKYSELAARFMVNNINYILFTLVFAIALCFKVFYRRRYYLAEYTAIDFYIAGLYILFSIITMLLNVYSDIQFSSGQLVLLFVLIFYCAVRFIRPVTFGSVSKSLLIGIFSVLLYMLFSFGLSLILVLIIS